MTATPLNPAQDDRSLRLAGIGLMLGGVCMFSFGDALGKHLVATYAVGQFLLFRAAAARSSGVAFAKAGSKRAAMSAKAKSGDDWGAIDACQIATLSALFSVDPERAGHLSVDVAGLHLDWSKTHRDAGLVTAFAGLA